MDKEFFNELLTEGAKELDIQAEIKAAREVFEHSEIVRQHNEKMHYLYDNLDKARKERTADVRKRYNKEITRNTVSEEKFKQFFERNKENIFQQFINLPSVMKDNIEYFNSLNKDERKKINKFIKKDNNLSSYENPLTTEEHADKLTHILIQTCIDFINTYGLTDIDGISFNADGLKVSAKYGEWTPSTDASITIEGIQKENDIETRKLIIGKNY